MIILNLNTTLVFIVLNDDSYTNKSSQISARFLFAFIRLKINSKIGN
jgi:hypothetical protein